MTWLDDFKKKEQRAMAEKARMAQEAESLARIEREMEWTIRRENHIKIVNFAATSSVETYLLEFANEIMIWHPNCASKASISRGMVFWEQKNPLITPLWIKDKKVKPEILKNFSYKPDQVLRMLYWPVYLYSQTATWVPRSDNDPGIRTTRFGFFFSITENGLFFDSVGSNDSAGSMNINDKTQIQEKIIDSFENSTPMRSIYLDETDKTKLVLPIDPK
ncbi:MAG: hypothetical protein GYA40_07385 [Chloroflexi bacterium]|nr:hypothetical protein [Chloroflexota bacterium]